MKRTAKWWSALTPEERSTLVMLERASNNHVATGGYLPDGYADCAADCGGVGTGGLCEACLNELIAIINKADNAGMEKG